MSWRTSATTTPPSPPGGRACVPAPSGIGVARVIETTGPAGRTFMSLPFTGTVDGHAVGGQLRRISTSVLDGVLMLTATMTGPGLFPDGSTMVAPVRHLDATPDFTGLTLELGPARVDKLDGVVDVAPLTLDVSLVPGSGNLHGNPLLTGLADGGGPLQSTAALLNRLLNGLGL